MRFVICQESSAPDLWSVLTIGGGGRQVAASNLGVMQVYSIDRPKCDADEIAIRLSVYADGSPEHVSWDIFPRTGAGKGASFASCDKCYTWLRHMYSWSTISTFVCVPRSSLRCAGLTVEANFTQNVNGFTAYSVNDGTFTLVASDVGPAVDGSKVYSLNDTVSGGGCDLTDFPSQSPSQQLSFTPTAT